MKLNACKKHLQSNMEMLTELQDQGWTIDRWGNAKMTTEGGKKYRMKFQQRNIRAELWGQYGKRECWLLVDTMKYNTK